MRGDWGSAPLRRAPLMLARYPTIAAAVAGAAAVLALTGAAAPLFVASAASASVNQQVAARCAYTLGFTAYGPPRTDGHGADSRADLARLTAGIPHLAPIVTTAFYGGSRTPVFVAAQGRTVDYPVSMIRREHQEQHITILADTHRDGLLLPDTLADAIGVRAGDEVQITSTDIGPVPVAAVYRDLNSEPKQAFWCDPELNVYSKGLLDDNPPPPLVLVRGTRYDSALARAGTTIYLYFERALAGDMTLPAAGRVVAPLIAAQGRLRTSYAPSPGDDQRPPLYGAGANSDLPFIVTRADAVSQSLAATCTAVAAAGSVVALLLLAGAGLLWVERRRVEVRLLSARGLAPLTVGAKALLEMVPPLVVGGLAGWALALWLVPTVGPSPFLPAGTAGAAALRAGAVIAAGAAVLLAVATIAIRHATERPLGHHRSRLAMVPWELGLLAAAWFTYAAIKDRGLPTFADTTMPRLDATQLLYPMLLLSGGTLLLARLFVLALRRWRGRPTRLHGAAYLAGRRLAGAPGVTGVLVVAAALSIGVLTFATTMTGTLRYTVDTKARVFVGSDAQVTLMSPLAKVPATLAGRSTTVLTTDTDVTGVGRVDVLAVDPATFPDAAAWDDRFGGPLGRLMSKIRTAGRGSAGGSAGGSVPVIAVGQLPDTFTLPLLELGGQLTQVPVRVVARPAAFPREQSNPLVVLDSSAVPAGARHLVSTELWVKGWNAASQAALHAAGARIRFVTTVADVSRAPDLAAVGWTYGFFEALGALTGVIAVGGLLLYLATRARARALGYGLTRRMGLRRAGHALSVLVEVGLALALGYLVGTGLATAGVAAVYGHLDPEQTLPPAPLLQLPLTAYAALAAATVAVALAATALAQHTADRARTADLLRLGVT